jgi:glycosyltransferase involved in cell wall biosynthesis/peptidoglycan/xylan/chitin deacetylase (PgdA/CDA1 family)
MDGALPPPAEAATQFIVTAPRFSIIIPTFQRRDMVTRTVRALSAQVERDFEVIVVDDGSTDGTADALEATTAEFPLKVIRQSNRGAGHARNAGAAAATGEILLFLDDDMQADPRMLQEHRRSHAAGASLVLGDLPLHPASPQNLLSRGVGTWARSRARRLATAEEIPVADLLTGQMSIARQVFNCLGGFDDSLTREGLFGGEDVDFGYRVRQAGHRIVFNPAAISHQVYDVDPARFLQRTYEAGRAEQELAFKHPERAGDMDDGLRFNSQRSRLLAAPLILSPEMLHRPLRAFVGRLVRTGRDTPRVRRAFMVARSVERQRGIRAARRALGMGRVVVLGYHALQDLSDDPVLRSYGLSPQRLAAQLALMQRLGWTFIDLDHLLDALEGRRHLPSRALLVTFDDAYEDLRLGMATLEAAGAPVMVFAVSGRVGGTNVWDQALGATGLPLLDAAGLREVAAKGAEIGSHTATHRPLDGLDDDALDEELCDSAGALQALGLPRPRALSYPHGRHDMSVVAAARRAGYRLAFGVTPGAVRRHSPRWALPRVEVMASDTPMRLALKITAASWPGPAAKRVLNRLR